MVEGHRMKRVSKIHNVYPCVTSYLEFKAISQMRIFWPQTAREDEWPQLLRRMLHEAYNTYL